MLKWRDEYVVGEGIRGHVQIQSKINAGKLVPGIWLITLPTNPRNLLDVIPAALLVQRNLYEHCPEIIGMAKSQEQAFEIVRDLVDYVYQKSGDVALREYLNDR